MIPTPIAGETRSSFGVRMALELVEEARRLGGRETCIYFVQSEDGPIKVGVADDPHEVAIHQRMVVVA